MFNSQEMASETHKRTCVVNSVSNAGWIEEYLLFPTVCGVICCVLFKKSPHVHKFAHAHEYMTVKS